MTNASHSRPRALVFGLGFTGRSIAERLLQLGWQVGGTGRTRPDMSGVDGLTFAGKPTPELENVLATCDLLVGSIPPGAGGADPVLEAFPELERTCRARAVVYLSATSVYGDREGKWAFEGEAPRPVSERGARRVEAELRWLETGLPVHVLRLAGIYGPGRSPFDKMGRAVVKPDHVVNRIHVEDIADLVARIAEHPVPGIYNVADGHPAPPQDVVREAARMAGAPAPVEVPWTDPSLSPMARSFYAETKRVGTTRVRATFGWTPRYPTYREGLAQIWAERAPR